MVKILYGDSSAGKITGYDQKILIGSLFDKRDTSIASMPSSASEIGVSFGGEAKHLITGKSFGEVPARQLEEFEKAIKSRIKDLNQQAGNAEIQIYGVSNKAANGTHEQIEAANTILQKIAKDNHLPFYAPKVETGKSNFSGFGQEPAPKKDALITREAPLPKDAKLQDKGLTLDQINGVKKTAKHEYADNDWRKNAMSFAKPEVHHGLFSKIGKIFRGESSEHKTKSQESTNPQHIHDNARLAVRDDLRTPR